MLKYILIPLANDSISFCHYTKGNKCGEIIPLNCLKDAIFWAMKENLNIQFLFPDYELPEEYREVIDSIDHTSIVSSTCKNDSAHSEAAIVVLDSWSSINSYPFKKEVSYVIRSLKDDFWENFRYLPLIFQKVDRIVVVITDIDKFESDDFEKYSKILKSLIPVIKSEYQKGHTLHFNLLTDRIFLDTMNNCNAGSESITLAPDGKFYICPAFYLNGGEPVGDLGSGVNIKNKQLYCLDHAPICRKCDAYQCRRCVWLNHKTTMEVNTPSHEQCVVAHIERNASKKLLETIREIGEFLPEKDIKQINYIDPFETILNI